MYIEFKKYLHGICDAGSRLLFEFRSGTHGLNEELGRNIEGGKTECSLCGNECENVSHVLWECSAYSSTRASFMKKLQEFLEDDYEDFESLENVEKSSYVLGSELWESKFDGLLALVKEYIVDVWEIQEHKLYDSDSGSGLQLHTQSSPGERSGKFSQNGMSGQKGKVHLGPNVSSSAHYRGCVVNGSNMSNTINPRRASVAVCPSACYHVFCCYAQQDGQYAILTGSVPHWLYFKKSVFCKNVAFERYGVTYSPRVAQASFKGS